MHVYICVIIFFYISNFKTISLNFLLINYNMININLINGLILIHPICIYLTYIYAIKFINTYNSLILKNNFNCFLKLKLFKMLLIFSITALLLGSFWSQQELNWGG